MINIFIFFFAICISYAFDANARNVLLIGFMFVSILAHFFYRFVLKVEFLAWLFIIFVLLSLLLSTAPIRYSTVLYSILFILSFISFIKLVNISNYSLDDFIWVTRTILIAYFLVVVLQQICVLLHLPIINARNYSYLEPWKLNSLSAEPSWAGRINALMMYAFLVILDIKNERKINFVESFKSNRLVWFCFLWTQVFIFSSTAIVFLCAVLFKYVEAKKIIYILPILLLIFFVQNNNIKSVERIENTAKSIITWDPDVIYQADSSASARVIPFIVLSRKVVDSFKDIDIFFGRGVDYSAKNIDYGMGGEIKASTAFTIWLDFGVFSFITYIIFSIIICVNRHDIISSLFFWFFMVFLYGLNTQIPWLTMMVLYLIKYFSKRSEVSEASHHL